MTNFEELLKILAQHHVEFVLIGGLAAVAQGSASVTYDLDLFYSRTPENIARLVKAFSPLNVKLRTLEGSVPFPFDKKTFQNTLNLTLDTDLGAVDLLADIPGYSSFDEIKQDSEVLSLFGQDCYVLSLDGLIKNKKATGRPKDLHQLQELQALKNLQKNKPRNFSQRHD